MSAAKRNGLRDHSIRPVHLAEALQLRREISEANEERAPGVGLADGV